MSDVLAAVDATGAAGPVLETAVLLAQRLGRSLRAVHVEPWSAAVEEQAAVLGVQLTLLPGPPEQSLPEAAADQSVDVVVMGLQDVPQGHGAGPLVRALAIRVQVPLIVVPPHAPLRRPPVRVLFPLDGTLRVSDAVRPVIATCVAAGIEVVALHVYDAATVPQFNDGPESEEVWRDEFLTRHLADLDVRLATAPGPLVPAVLRAAAERDADMIALPAHPDTFQRECSVIFQVLTSADRPVALVPVERKSLTELERVGAHGAPTGA